MKQNPTQNNSASSEDAEYPIFARDLPLLLSEVYKKMGQVAPTEEGLSLIDLVEWIHRLPSKRPRSVHISDVLRTKILTLYEIEALRRIELNLRAGLSLRPYLGDRTAAIRNRKREKRDPKMRNDLFFSDWALHHFHLGADFANTGKRVARSRRVLIAYLTESDAFLIDIDSHGIGNADLWGRTQYLEALYRNWPEVLAPFELKGISSAPKDDRFNALDRLKLREAGVQTFTEINGKVFMGPGMGIATDGSSVRAVSMAGRIREELAYAEELYREHKPEGEAFLFVNGKASVGFYDPYQDIALSTLPSKNSRYFTTIFFKRIIEEAGLLSNAPSGSIWLSYLCPATS